MPNITASPNPEDGYFWISINWADIPAVTNARVIRRDVQSGVESVVRTNTATDTTGEYIELSGGAAILYDTEAPFDRPVMYRTEALGSASTASTGLDQTLASSGRLFLRDPLRPYLDQDIHLRADTPCLTVGGIYFQSMQSENHAARNVAQTVVNRRNPVPVTRVRGGITSTLNLVTRTFADRDAVLAEVDTGAPLLLTAPAVYGIPDRYMSVSDVAVNRLVDDHRRQWRLVMLPHVEVDRPAGLSYGTLGARWADLCTVYPAFADATAASLSWRGVLNGQGAVAGVGGSSTWRTWAEVNAGFATWSAVNSGGRTWQDLLEGR